MDLILITTGVITLIGLIVGAGLVFTGKKFYVEVDQREAAVREALPGNNCGACGFAGCDAMAAAIAKGEAPVNGCPVGGGPVAAKIGAIMGAEAGEVQRKVAFVQCKGSCQVTKNQGNYVGIPDCASAVRAGLALTDCDYGCVGLGTCVKLCPEHAITVRDDHPAACGKPGGCAVLQPGQRPPGEAGLLCRLSWLHALHPPVRARGHHRGEQPGPHPL